MSAMVKAERIALPGGLRALAVTLNNPARCNALTEPFLAELEAALAEDAGAPFVLIAAEGRHFSTGGDIAAFDRAAREGRAAAHAAALVGALQRIVLALKARDAIVVAAAQGAITGGAAGLVLAADLAALSEDAFLQPWYREVGFAPDGGWAALLPETVGARRALAWQLRNARIDAREALRLGIADLVTERDGLAGAAARMLADLAEAADPQALVAAKRLVWDEARLAALERRLAAERDAFAARIDLGSTRAGMERFLSRNS
ncbi:enoyl-CoA hydratase/isomerase family protein [Oceanicella actignis]|uniref:enoyl-CoA hydratase/isomerase family protein n=1 Tax=Oceanicella actignis TaxID=1189325 RepID=UPI0011E82733|nr:enoyl-CoA hydratase/isomerase family protein [Oceanicella actignis]TYO91304.1 2-(1,2-epoxy-1,2-dihydrophenyl)acetyl-CoA isomerase [Oceanicella actignis]